MSSQPFYRYLKLLDIQPENQGLDELTTIIRAHLKKVPFENISKLYYYQTIGMKQIPDLSQYLDGIEQYHFGGTCYANNYFLNQLLRFLGYDVKLCGADMKRADSHIVNVVAIDKKEYLVDVGYAAPFLDPIPIDLIFDYKLSLGTDEYTLKPKDSNGYSQMKLFRNGMDHHGYEVNPIPRRIEEFTDVVKDSFRPEATFMNSLLLVRFEQNYSQVIHNMEYIESRGKQVEKTVFKTKEEIPAKMEKIFHIPPAVSRMVIKNLNLSQDAWH